VTRYTIDAPDREAQASPLGGLAGQQKRPD
jgi:hypothetical protein